MVNNIEYGMTLPEKSFNKATFIALLNAEPYVKILAGENRILIRECITVSPNALYLAALHRPMTEEARQTAIATLSTSRKYYIESMDESVEKRTKLKVGDEVLLDWSNAINMIRVDARTETPNLIEAAAAIGSFTFAESKGLSKMPDVTISEYLMIWSQSIIGVYTGNVEKDVFGAIEVTKAEPKQNFLKPDMSRF